MSTFAKPISGYMTSPVHTVHVDDALPDVERVLVERRVSCLPVVGRDEQVAGVISHSDLLQIGHVMARTIGGKELLNLPSMCAGDLMTTKLVSATRETTVSGAARAMRERNIHRLFVLDGGRAVGVFSARDVMTAIIEEKVAAPIATFMTAPALTIEAGEPVSIAAEKLYGARVTGVIVVEKGTPAGVFTQVEALAARELPKTTPVGEAVGYSLLCLPAQTPLYRAAGFALQTRARRVAVLDEKGIAGVLTGLNFAAAAAAA